jgi:integrase
VRLTDQTIRRLDPPARGGDSVMFDDAVPGFAIRIKASNTRSFVLMYRRKSDGKQRRFTIGAFGAWNTTQAREEARRIKREVDAGGDPVGEREDIRTAPTMANLAERFIADYLPRKRPSTQRVYGQQIAADVVPAFGTMKVAAVTHADVDGWHRRMRARPTHANRTLAVLSKMLTLAVRWGWRPDNPCKGVERFGEEKRTRYLSGAELDRLTAALDKLPDQSAADAVRLLLLTGARRGELLAAKWANIDLEAGVWNKPGATTKTKTLHSVPLSQPACRLLAEMRERADSDWLFPARSGDGHRSHINATWIGLRKAAKLPGVRLHDLRHTYATILASSGLSLPVIGKLLGHTTPIMTQRYAHLTDDPLRQATERVGSIIQGRGSAEIVPLDPHLRGDRGAGKRLINGKAKNDSFR